MCAVTCFKRIEVDFKNLDFQFILRLLPFPNCYSSGIIIPGVVVTPVDRGSIPDSCTANKRRRTRKGRCVGSRVSSLPSEVQQTVPMWCVIACFMFSLYWLDNIELDWRPHFTLVSLPQLEYLDEINMLLLVKRLIMLRLASWLALTF